MKISPISIMYLIGIGLTFAGMGLLTAGVIIPGIVGIVIGSIILLKGANSKIRLKTMEEERQNREDMDKQRAERERKRRGLQKAPGGVLYPCENLVYKGLRDIETPVAKAINDLVSSQDFNSISHQELADKMELVLLGKQWRWPEFERFLEEVERRRILPVVWREFNLLSWKMPASANSVIISYVLKDFNNVSDKAKLALLRSNMLGVTEKILVPVENFKMDMPDDVYLEILQELTEAGIVERLSGKADRMELLSAAKLVEIMETHGVRVQGDGKEVVIEEILKVVPDDDLKEIFKTEKIPQEVIRGGIIVSKDLVSAIKWERARIRLLAHTIYFTHKNTEFIKSHEEEESEVILELIGDDCPVCRDKIRSIFRKPVKVKDLKKDNIPPFHPGCRCLLKEVKEG